MPESVESEVNRALAEPIPDLAIPDPEGIGRGCLVAIVLTTPLAAAVPIAGGLLVAILGFVWARAGKKERHVALRHRLDQPPIPLSAIRVGEPATLAGKVRGPATVETPLGNEAVIAALWMDEDVGDDVEDPSPSWTKQLGKRLVLETSGGTIEVDGPIGLISEKSTTTTQMDGLPPAFAPIDGEERRALGERCAQYGERWLEPDMDVIVTGVVRSIEDEVTAAERGYRGQGRRRRVVVTPGSDGEVRVSSYSPHRIADLARQARAQEIGGVYMVGVGICSLLLWSKMLSC